MIGQFIAVLFLARELAHREHLRTKSYAQHMALGDFYEGVLGLTDSLAEAYQGRNGIIDIPLLDNEFPGPVIQSMQAQLAWIEKNRDAAVGKHAASDEEEELVGEDEIYGIQRNLDPYLVSAIKALTAQVKQLQQEIAQLKGA